MFDRKEVSEARAALKAVGVHSLLAAPSSNPKLAKSLKLKVMSAPLHLSPADTSGYNVCPNATAGCKAACLHTAGNPAYWRGKERARLARTRAYFEKRQQFMVALAADIERLVQMAKRARHKPAIRLNATSDIPWERIPVTLAGKTYTSLMDAFPRVQFYDYTKRPNRRSLPANYHLTFSLAEGNELDASLALRAGMNVAAVYDTKRGAALPTHDWLGMVKAQVIDGDEHDFRPADPKGVIVGLRAKGRAIGDTSGFVRHA